MSILFILVMAFLASAITRLSSLLCEKAANEVNTKAIVITDFMFVLNSLKFVKHVS